MTEQELRALVREAIAKVGAGSGRSEDRRLRIELPTGHSSHAMFTLAPWARKIEAEFARSVFPSSGQFELELDLSGFLRGDPATRWNAHKIAIEAGVLDPDEVRQVEGWNPRTKPRPLVVA